MHYISVVNLAESTFGGEKKSMLKENARKLFASDGVYVYVNNFITKNNLSICKFSSDVNLVIFICTRGRFGPNISMTLKQT